MVDRSCDALPNDVFIELKIDVVRDDSETTRDTFESRGVSTNKNFFLRVFHQNMTSYELKRVISLSNIISHAME